jgi:hypothetical protein
MLRSVIMLVKVIVLAGLAIYLFIAGDIGLALMAVSGTIPGVGILLAGILAAILIVKSWYGSAAIAAGLIAFHLAANALLDQRLKARSFLWKAHLSE